MGLYSDNKSQFKTRATQLAIVRDVYSHTRQSIHLHNKTFRDRKDDEELRGLLRASCNMLFPTIQVKTTYEDQLPCGRAASESSSSYSSSSSSSPTTSPALSHSSQPLSPCCYLPSGPAKRVQTPLDDLTEQHVPRIKPIYEFFFGELLGDTDGCRWLQPNSPIWEITEFLPTS